jgi:diguanylate cyclase (GGDEF)-like protein/PAS domain S-box-containing protein
LRASEERFRLIVEHAPIGMALLTLGGEYRRVNPAFCAFVGRDEPELLANSLGAVMHRDDVVHHLDLLSRTIEGDLPGFRLECRYLRPDGSSVWGDVSVAVVQDEGGRPQSCIVQVVDITDRKLAEERLRHDALHDPLTGLRNRAGLEAALDDAVEALRLTGSPTTVLYVDLDRFKAVNDTHGHGVGDELLRAVAGRIERCVRPDDTVARLGGDEFVIVARGIGDERAAAALSDRVRRAIGQPLRTKGLTLHVGASVGSHVVGAGETAEAILGSADRSMYGMKLRRAGGRDTEDVIDLDALVGSGPGAADAPGAPRRSAARSPRRAAVRS